MGKKAPLPGVQTEGRQGSHDPQNYIVSISQRWEKVNERYPN